MIAMPARWQSSQRPLFVRTVWVNGLRHAILSEDDPLLQHRRGHGWRPGSCSSVGTFTSSSSGSGHNCDDTASCDLERCLIKLQLVLTSNKPPSKSNTRTSSSHRSSSSRSRQDVGQCCEEHQNSGQDAEENNSVGPTSMVGHYRRPYLPYAFPSSSEDEQEPVEDDPWLFSDVESLLPDLRLNPLSERVLQWLDLAGKTAGMLEGSEGENAHVSRCGGKERPTSRYFPTSPSEVATNRIYTLQRQRNVDAGGKMSTVTNLETASINSSLSEEPLHVTASGLKTVRRKRQAFEDACAVIDETVRCDSPVVKEDVCFQPMPPSVDSAAQHPVCRPQLHIFMPTLERDRPALRHQDAADNVSECESYWSEA